MNNSLSFRLTQLESSLSGLSIAILSLKNMVKNGEKIEYRRFHEVANVTKDEINKTLNVLNDLTDTS